jgi:hypothetical protein
LRRNERLSPVGYGDTIPDISQTVKRFALALLASRGMAADLSRRRRPLCLYYFRPAQIEQRTRHNCDDWPARHCRIGGSIGIDVMHQMSLGRSGETSLKRRPDWIRRLFVRLRHGRHVAGDSRYKPALPIFRRGFVFFVIELCRCRGKQQATATP